MIKVLFAGNYLSRSKGSLGVSEQIALALPKKLFNVRLTSRMQNQLIRLLDITLVCLGSSYKKMQIDIYSGPAFIIAEVASFVAKAKGIKPILTLHGGMLPEFYQKNEKRIKRVFNRAAYIQTPSLYLKDFFQKQGILISYLPNPIHLETFPYSRKNLKRHSLLWVRAFTPIYNPDLAVKALFEVKKKYPDANLTMIGPDKGLLAKTILLINELELNSSITIIGPVKNDELYKYYQSHEVFLNTTSFESFGVAVVEAAACGIPVVSTKVGEMPYLWQHEENMLQVDNFEAKAFAEEIIKLFKSKELAGKISKNARAKAESFDWEKIKSKWIDLLSA
jgi:glycosyltransferase involved in cell wall biosynthesis